MTTPVSSLVESKRPRPGVGARALAAIQRHLQPVTLSLDQVRAERPPRLPPLDRGAHGYAIHSLPAAHIEALATQTGMQAIVGRRFVRRSIDLSGGFDAYQAGLSAQLHAELGDATARGAAMSGGTIDIRRFRTADELARFHDIAHRIALRGHQHPLGGALPDDPASLRIMAEMAAADRIRAWILYLGGDPAAYLYCPVVNANVLREHAGHDPAFADLRPAAILQWRALRDLFGEPALRHFDFGLRDGADPRQFATGGVACVDLLLLRTSLATRVAALTLGAIDRAKGAGKRARGRLGLVKN